MDIPQSKSAMRAIVKSVENTKQGKQPREQKRKQWRFQK